MDKIPYISLFSGIEAVSCALDHNIWQPVAFSEIDDFPSAVLAHHYPTIPNLGDITQIDWTPYVGRIPVIWGGSPCQSFSIAGKREGLDGASGLMWEYVRAIREIRPTFFVWENVPGALSSSHGQDFRCLLESMDELGYGLAWRVLDAQFFGVAQRRRRVFLVGSLGTQRAAEILFEREGMPWDYSPSREKRQALTGRAEEGIGATDNRNGGCLNPGESQSRRIYASTGIFPSLSARTSSGQNQQCVYLCEKANDNSNGLGISRSDVMNTLDTHANTAVAIDFHQQDGRFRISETPDVSATITAHAGTGGNNVPMVKVTTNRLFTPITMMDTQSHAAIGYDQCNTLTAHAGKDAPIVTTGYQVRRLTPLECERLQGFPDGWTDIIYKGKPAPDSKRYKALGNSMAVPVMRWIGKRLEEAIRCMDSFSLSA